MSRVSPSSQTSDGGGGGMSDKKSLLVLVNPISGTGNALQLFKKHLEPRLKAERVPYELIVTKFAGEAKSLLSKPEESFALSIKSRYSGVVCVSGDGLVNEVLNGFKSRPDWPQIGRDIPIGLLPGGSGCALNCSLLRYLNQSFAEEMGAEKSARNVLSGTTTPLDLIEVELCTGEKAVSFLGVTIGAIADCDINSEWLRCLGFIRAYLYIGWRFLFPSPNRAKVSYLPLEIDKRTGKPVPVRQDEDVVDLPELHHQLPKGRGWITEEGDYHVVYAMNLSMLDPWTLFSPKSEPGDGVIWLVSVKASITRMQLLKWFLSLSEGPDQDSLSSDISLIPVKAFRIEPVEPTEGCILSLDAESVPFGPVQGKLMPKAAHLMADLTQKT